MTSARTAGRPQPLGVWDCTDPANIWRRHMAEASAWAVRHLQQANETYRAEFYLIDAPYAVLYRYACDANGRTFTDPRTGRMATADPVTQVLGELPAPRLLGVPA